MKITLLYPPPSPEYETIRMGYEPINTAPQTAHAVLAAYLENKFGEEVEIQTISDQEVTDLETNPPKYRNRNISDIVQSCKSSDIVGMTCLFHNQSTALDIAQKVKAQNQKVKVVLGGQNVSNPIIAERILNQFSAIDYVVLREGEEALLGLAQNKPEQQIPNLVYRDASGKSSFTFQHTINLNNIPLWDFKHLVDKEKVLAVYDSRTDNYRKAQELFNGMMPRLGVFSLRGCAKYVNGVNGGRKGPCSFCTTGESKLRILNPDQFWQQIAHLYQKDGLRDFFIADDIFPISPEYIGNIAKAKKKFESELSPKLNFRVYAYPTSFQCKDGEAMVNDLKAIGVNNVFLGVESFDEDVSRRANKDHFDYQTVFNVIISFFHSGL